MSSYYDKYEFFNLSILNSPIEISKGELESIIDNWWGEKRIHEERLDLNKVNPPPIVKHGGAHFIKFVIWEPIQNPDTTALFVNLQDAYSSLISTWNEKFKKQAITLRLSNDAICEYPHHEFFFRTKDNKERIVYTHFESKWEFFQYGDICDFENAELYKKRIIKDRLNNKIINDYMNKLGYMIESDVFYTSKKKAMYFEELKWKEQSPWEMLLGDKPTGEFC